MLTAWLLLPPAVLMAAISAFAARASMRVWRQGGMVGGCARSGVSLSTALASLACFAAWLNLSTYDRLTHEQPVAEITVNESAPGQRVVEIVSASWPTPRLFPLPDGDWQLDARVLKWAPWANILGLDARYRLERLSARPARVYMSANYLGYALHDGPAEWLDVWALAYAGWVPAVDTVYGSSVYGTLTPGLRYKVSLSQSGLVLRNAAN